MQLSPQSRQRLLYFSSNNTNKGLTLPGFLGRILMYSSVFVTLLLPFYDFKDNTFMGAGSRMREQEALANIGAMNRAQQAYFIEKKVFTDSLVKLGIGIQPDTDSYSYRILSPMVPVQSVAQAVKPAAASQQIVMVAQPKRRPYKTYIGLVYTGKKLTDEADPFTSDQTCKIESWVDLRSAVPILNDEVMQCPPMKGLLMQ